MDFRSASHIQYRSIFSLRNAGSGCVKPSEGAAAASCL